MGPEAGFGCFVGCFFVVPLLFNKYGPFEVFDIRVNLFSGG